VAGCATSQITDALFIVTAGMPTPAGARPHQNCAAALNRAKGITFSVKIHVLDIDRCGWTDLQRAGVFAVLFRNASC